MLFLKDHIHLFDKNAFSMAWFKQFSISRSVNSTHLFPPFPTAGVNPGMIPSSSSLPAGCARSVSPDDVVAAPDNADGVGVVITGVVDAFAWLDVYGMEFSLKNYCYKRAYI